MNTENRPTVSIVIPVYNGARFLPDCLESLNRQTSTEFEALFVDDGSTDQSAEILNDASLHHPAYHVIHQANAGSGSARNTGIKAANGTIVCFLDVDDRIVPEFVKTVQTEMDRNADILVFGASVDFLEEGYSLARIPAKRNAMRNSREVISDLLIKDSLNPLWNKAYRRSLLPENQNWFPTDFSQGEDLIFNCRAFTQAKTVQCIDTVLYHYLKRSEETMVSSYTANHEHILMEKKKALELLFPDSNDPVLCQYMLKEYEAYVINLVMPGCSMKKKEKVECVKRVVITKEALAQIDSGNPDYFNGRVFRFLCKFHSASFLVSSYQLLNHLRYTFSMTYKKKRKQSYQAKENNTNE